MMPIFCAICFIAATVVTTASPPSSVSLAACAAMPSVMRALSVFCPIEAVICSSEALVSSTPAACSVEAWLSDCAVALTSSEAPARVCALALTSPTTCCNLPTMRCIANSNCPASSFDLTSISTLRSPSAIALATSTALPIGLVTLRLMKKPIPTPSSTPPTMIAVSILALLTWIAWVAALSSAARVSLMAASSLISRSSSSEAPRTLPDRSMSSGLVCCSGSRATFSTNRPRCSR